MTGAAETIVQDGVNGIVVDPRDTHALAAALHRAVDPQTLRALRAGVQRMNASLTPDAAAEVILRAVRWRGVVQPPVERRGSREARQTTSQPRSLRCSFTHVIYHHCSEIAGPERVV